MAEIERERRPSRLTARGAATRARIVRAASDLMRVKGGVAATTLDDIRVASETSKSQLYHHFADKDALVQAVIALRGDEVLAREEKRLRRLDSFRGLERWRDAVVQTNALLDGAYGCGLGSLANELADTDEDARVALAGILARWEELFQAGLLRMRENGVLRADADPATLATGLMAALQGGYLLAQTAHDTAPLTVGLDMAIDRIRSFSAA